MDAGEQEGVIKFRLDFQHRAVDPTIDLASLIAWRSILHRLGLIGQDPLRYNGLGFGNISMRLCSQSASGPDHNTFIISGTQTGLQQWVTADQFCIVSSACVKSNKIVAHGPVRPSSEALTHAAVYRCHPAIRYVMHIHNPEIWQSTGVLNLPSIDQSIAYGTPAMANAVETLIKSGIGSNSGLFSMLGHGDGIVSFAESAATAANLLIDTLARALSLQPIYGSRTDPC